MNLRKVAGLNQLNRKIAPIFNGLFFFSLSTLVLQYLFTVLFRGDEMIPSYSIPVTRRFSASVFVILVNIY